MGVTFLAQLVMVVVVFGMILLVAEPLQTLQTALWHAIYRNGTLRHQLLTTTTTTTTSTEEEEAKEEEAKGETPTTSTVVPAWKTSSFWMARLATFNLIILPACLLGSNVIQWDPSHGTISFSHQPLGGTSKDLWFLALWIGTLWLQLHSLLQDYLLGALLLCVNLLQNTQQQQQQQRPSNNTTNESKEEQEDGSSLSSSSLDWISNVFANRPTGLLLVQASQLLVFPVVLVLLVVVALTCASTSQPDVRMISPVVYQVATPYQAPWQELLDWNQYQTNLVVMGHDGQDLPEMPESWKSQWFANTTEASDPTWFAADPWELLSPQALPPLQRETTQESSPRALLPLLRQVQEYAKQSQKDPEIHRALTSSNENDDDGDLPADSPYAQVKATLRQLRFTLAMIFQHSILSQRVLYLASVGLLQLLIVYWLLSLCLVWIFSRHEFQRMTAHAKFLEQTLKMNKTSNDSNDGSTSTKSKKKKKTN